MTNPITAWSFSRLALYEECPAKFKYRHIDKLPEEKHPAMQRGIDIHNDAQSFLIGDHMLPQPTLMRFSSMLKDLREMKPMVEQQWALDRNWKPTGWFAKDCWVRVIIDAGVIYPGDREAAVIDWKTGKKYGDNADQMELFAITTFQMFPMLREVDTHLCYLDSGEEDQETFTKEGIAEAKREWEDRVEPLFNDTRFLPRPSKRCHWCAFSRAKGGPCAH